MTRTGAFEPVEVSCRNGHKFPTTVRREGTKCPECTTTVYVRKNGTVGYLRGVQTDPTPGRTDPKVTTIPKVKVTPNGRRTRSQPDRVRATPKPSTEGSDTPENPDTGGDGTSTDKPERVGTPAGNKSTIQSAGRKRSGRKPARTPYGHVY